MEDKLCPIKSQRGICSVAVAIFFSFFLELYFFRQLACYSTLIKKKTTILVSVCKKCVTHHNILCPPKAFVSAQLDSLALNNGGKLIVIETSDKINKNKWILCILDLS